MTPDLLPFRQGGGWGYRTPKGEVPIPPIYQLTESFWGNIARFRLAGREGLMNRDGRWILDPGPARLKVAHPDRVWVCRFGNLSWHLCRPNGEDVGPEIYRDGGWFTRGLAAAASRKGKYGFVDGMGQWVIPPRFHQVHGFLEDVTGAMTEPGIWCLVDRTGEMVLGPDFSSVGLFSQGLAPATVAPIPGAPVGLIDTTGRFVVPPRFQALGTVDDGLVAARMGDRWGFVDLAGDWVVEPRFENVGTHAFGSATVFEGGRWGIIRLHASGQMEYVKRPRILHPPLLFSGHWRIRPEDHWTALDARGEPMGGAALRDVFSGPTETALVGQCETGYGLLGEEGTFTSRCDFDKYHKTEGAFAIFQKGETKVWLDGKGTPCYEAPADAEIFDYGLAQLITVKGQGDLLVSTRTWKPLVQEKIVDFPAPTSERRLAVGTPAGVGLLDLATGDWIIPPVFEDLTVFGDDETLHGKQGGKWGLLDATGNWIAQPVYDSILRHGSRGHGLRIGKSTHLVDAKGASLCDEPLLYIRANGNLFQAKSFAGEYMIWDRGAWHRYAEKPLPVSDDRWLIRVEGLLRFPDPSSPLAPYTFLDARLGDGRLFPARTSRGWGMFDLGLARWATEPLPGQEPRTITSGAAGWALAVNGGMVLYHEPGNPLFLPGVQWLAVSLTHPHLIGTRSGPECRIWNLQTREEIAGPFSQVMPLPGGFFIAHLHDAVGVVQPDGSWKIPPVHGGIVQGPGGTWWVNRQRDPHRFIPARPAFGGEETEEDGDPGPT